MRLKRSWGYISFPDRNNHKKEIKKGKQNKIKKGKQNKIKKGKQNKIKNNKIKTKYFFC
jgi:hypothetical protein